MTVARDGWRKIMSNSSKNELTSSREITADELIHVTGGMGPVLLFRANNGGSGNKAIEITDWSFDVNNPVTT
jgi:hypothetical protein